LIDVKSIAVSNDYKAITTCDLGGEAVIESPVATEVGKTRPPRIADPRETTGDIPAAFTVVDCGRRRAIDLRCTFGD
jgi:hypothetical protein